MDLGDTTDSDSTDAVAETSTDRTRHRSKRVRGEDCSSTSRAGAETPRDRHPNTTLKTPLTGKAKEYIAGIMTILQEEGVIKMLDNLDDDTDSD